LEYSVLSKSVATGGRERTEPPGRLWGWSPSVLSRQHRDSAHWDSTNLESLIPLLPTLDFLNVIALEKGGGCSLANEKCSLLFWMNLRLWEPMS